VLRVGKSLSDLKTIAPRQSTAAPVRTLYYSPRLLTESPVAFFRVKGSRNADSSARARCPSSALRYGRRPQPKEGRALLPVPNRGDGQERPHRTHRADATGSLAKWPCVILEPNHFDRKSACWGFAAAPADPVEPLLNPLCSHDPKMPFRHPRPSQDAQSARMSGRTYVPHHPGNSTREVDDSANDSSGSRSKSPSASTVHSCNCTWHGSSTCCTPSLSTLLRRAAVEKLPVGRALLPVRCAFDGQECPSYW